MTRNTSEIGIPRAIFELFGIILARFRPVPRIWGAWLIAVNSAALLFIGHVEARVALGAVGVAVLSQGLIYQRRRFIRALGTTHAVWIPMIAWMLQRLPALPAETSAFGVWLVLLIVTNTFSLVIDAWDATRFALGERRPYYAW